jgi:hypothetical protein
MQNAILLITAVAGWLAFALTWGQLRAANRQLALNVSMAAPKIGTITVALVRAAVPVGPALADSVKRCLGFALMD